MIRKLLGIVGIYKLYEWWLKHQLKNDVKIKHIAIIADEPSNHITFVKNHSTLSKKILDLLKWCVELDVKYITIYALSLEHLISNKESMSEAITQLENELNTLLSEGYLQRFNIRFKAIGRIDLLPEKVKSLIRIIEESTKNNDAFYLNLAVAYRGRAEIVDAARRIADDIIAGKLEPDELNEKILERYLYTSHLPKQDPDLIIRTSGNEKLSGFLLWQSAYSELCFLDVYWPDLRKIDLLRAVRTYQKRKRRFGA